jgi:sarcosine oxidase
VAPDVIVVGLGSMGAAAAYHLAGRGLKVLGLDRFTPPHGRGAHAGGSRIIRMAYAEGAGYVPLLRRAYQLWTEAELAGGVRLLTRTGGLMLARPGSHAVRGAQETARAHGLDHEMLDAAQVRRRFPAFTPADDDVGLYEEAAGLLRPELAVATYLRLAAGAGADLRYGVTVTGWRAGAGGATVVTPAGELSAARLVLCPGPWAGRLLADLGVPFVVHRRVQHYWRTPAAEFTVGRCPVWIWESAPGTTAYGLPATAPPPPPAGEPVVKAAFHHGDDPADPDAGPAPVTDADRRSIVDWLATRLPALAAGTWVGGRVCLYTLTPDEHFVLGRHPRHDGVVVAAGFSGHGFKFVPVVGEIIADLVEHGRSPLRPDLFAPDLFAPDRFAPGRSG